MVLEARKDAETIWYNILWEEAKSASNVVDYNLNQEITKDTSAASNANNDTTTGMANVIPWINAPKLVYSTSIVWYPQYPVTVLALKGTWFPPSYWWYFNDNTIVSWEDVTIDANSPEVMYLRRWTYFIFLKFNSTKTPTITYVLRMTNMKDNWQSEVMFRYEWVASEYTTCTLYQMESGYFSIMLTPEDYNMTWAKCDMTFIRIW